MSNQGFERIHDGRFYSGIVEAGASFSYTFTEPGVYPYFCSLHPWMNGFVLVEQGDMAEREREVTNGDAIVSDADDDEENDETNESTGKAEEEDPDDEAEEEFILNSSKLKVVCCKCLGLICWWPLSTQQIVSAAARRTRKYSKLNRLNPADRV